MFGWKRKQLSPREEVTLSRFLSSAVQIDPDSISYTVYRGYNGSIPTACLVVGFGLDLWDRSDKGFLIEMCDADFVRGREIDSVVSTYHKQAKLVSKLSGQPLFDEIVRLQVQRDKLADQLAQQEGEPKSSAGLKDAMETYDTGETTRAEFIADLSDLISIKILPILDEYDDGELTRSEAMSALRQAIRSVAE